jgi:hypothetical protein
MVLTSNFISDELSELRLTCLIFSYLHRSSIYKVDHQNASHSVHKVTVIPHFVTSDKVLGFLLLKNY